MPPVVEPEDSARDEERGEPEQGREDRGADQEGRQPRQELMAAEHHLGRLHRMKQARDVAVKQGLQVHRTQAVAVAQQEVAEPIADRKDDSPGRDLAGEGAEQGVDLVQPKQKRERQGEEKVDADEGREADPDAETDGCRHPIGRLLAAEQVEDEDLPAASPAQGMRMASAERARPRDLHARSSRWSWPTPETSRSRPPAARTAPSPASTRPIEWTGTPAAPAARSIAGRASGGAVKRSS